MADMTDERPYDDASGGGGEDEEYGFLPLGCIICGGAVEYDLDALCAEHEEAFASLARGIVNGFITDWPDCAHVATHDELMCGDFEPSDQMGWWDFLVSLGVA